MNRRHRQSVTFERNVDVTGNLSVTGTMTVTGAQTLTGAATLSAGATIASGQTLAVTTADKLTVGGIIVPQYVVVNHKLNPANTAGEFVFIADAAYTVVSVKEIHNVVAGQACACSVRKLTTAGKLADAAIGSGVIDLLAADLDLTSTAATTVTASLSAVAGALDLAAGDRIGIKTGNATSLVGGVVTIVLKRI